MVYGELCSMKKTGNILYMKINLLLYKNKEQNQIFNILHIKINNLSSTDHLKKVL